MTEFAAISSVILFAISVFTFVTSLLTKAQNDGKILERIEQTQKDVAEIKQSLKEKNKDVEALKISTENQEQRIKSLERRTTGLEDKLHSLEVKG